MMKGAEAARRICFSVRVPVSCSPLLVSWSVLLLLLLLLCGMLGDSREEGGASPLLTI